MAIIHKGYLEPKSKLDENPKTKLVGVIEGYTDEAVTKVLPIKVIDPLLRHFGVYKISPTVGVHDELRFANVLMQCALLNIYSPAFQLVVNPFQQVFTTSVGKDQKHLRQQFVRWFCTRNVVPIVVFNPAEAYTDELVEILQVIQQSAAIPHLEATVSAAKAIDKVVKALTEVFNGAVSSKKTRFFE